MATASGVVSSPHQNGFALSQEILENASTVLKIVSVAALIFAVYFVSIAAAIAGAGALSLAILAGNQEVSQTNITPPGVPPPPPPGTNPFAPSAAGAGAPPPPGNRPCMFATAGAGIVRKFSLEAPLPQRSVPQHTQPSGGDVQGELVARLQGGNLGLRPAACRRTPDPRPVGGSLERALQEARARVSTRSRTPSLRSDSGSGWKATPIRSAEPLPSGPAAPQTGGRRSLPSPRRGSATSYEETPPSPLPTPPPEGGVGSLQRKLLLLRAAVVGRSAPTSPQPSSPQPQRLAFEEENATSDTKANP